MQQRTKYFYFGALAICLFFAACKGSKSLSTPKGTAVEQPKIKIEDYYQQGINYNSFSGKASLHYKDAKQNQKLGSTIKMNHLKNIWTSVSAVGGFIEVARAFITPDSLKALVPINKDAYALSYKDGLALIQTELDFVSLQNLFIGNPLITNAKNAKAHEEDGNVIISIQHKDYQLVITYDKKTQLIQEQMITNAAKKFSCLIIQDNYKPLADKQPFSFKRQIIVDNNGQKLNLDMDFSKAEIDLPTEVNFKIPDSYTIKQIK